MSQSDPEIVRWKTNSPVDGTTGGNTLIYDVEDAFTIIDVYFIPRTLTTVITPPTISVGQNSSSYNSIIASLLAPVGMSVDDIRSLVNPLSFASRKIGPSGLYVRVATPAVATAFDFDIIVLGARMS